jgi:rhamnogalacturonyl hydrolase YesR
MLIGLIEAIENLPKDHPDYSLIVRYLEETAEGLCQAQDETGLWHCIVDDPSTRLEASGTAMIVRAYCHAWQVGVCRTPQVRQMLTKAWCGLKAHTVGGRTFSFLWAFGATHDKAGYSRKPSSGTPYLAPLAGPEYVKTFGPLVP